MMNANESGAMAMQPTGCIPQLLDWRGACAALGGSRPISRATLDRLTKSGALRVRRPAPGVVRWAVQDIADYLNAVIFPQREEVE